MASDTAWKKMSEMQGVTAAPVPFSPPSMFFVAPRLAHSKGTQNAKQANVFHSPRAERQTPREPVIPSRVLSGLPSLITASNTALPAFRAQSLPCLAASNTRVPKQCSFVRSAESRIGGQPRRSTSGGFNGPREAFVIRMSWQGRRRAKASGLGRNSRWIEADARGCRSSSLRLWRKNRSQREYDEHRSRAWMRWAGR
jgi:hypothetical protein